MSLNPSIANYQTVDFVLAVKKKLIIHEDAATKDKSVQHTLQIVLHRALLAIMSRTRPKLFPYRRQEILCVTTPSLTYLAH